MRMKSTLLGLLLIVALMLAACGAADSEPELPAVAQAASVDTSDVMAKGDDDTMAEGDTMSKQDDTATAESDAVARQDDVARAEGDALTKQGDATKAEDETMAKREDAGMAAGAAVAKPDDAAMAQGEASAADGVMAEADAAMALPAWLTAELVDVTTGQPFAIADQQGKVVLVETLAVWCSNCLRQQQQIKALHEALGERADLVSVGLDIDLNESPEQLRAHAERHGFDWTYAVATPEVAREIGQLYGNLFLNPPSTPMLVVDRQGQVHPLPFGIKNAGELQETLAPFLGGS